MKKPSAIILAEGFVVCGLKGCHTVAAALGKPKVAAVVRQSYNPLQIILKILRNLSNQMRSVGTSNIVAVAGIDEIV